MAGQVATSHPYVPGLMLAVSDGSNPSPGLSLARLLELAPLTPEQGAMVGAAILNQIAVAGADAYAAADLQTRHVRIFSDGTVSIAAAHLAAADQEKDPRATLRAAGRLLCIALGVSPESDLEPAFTAAEAVALPLVVQARAMAVGAAGADPLSALHTYLERAGRLGSAERLNCSREELGALVSRLLLSAAPLPLPQQSPVAAARPAPPQFRRPWRLPAAIAGGLALVVVTAVVIVTAAVRPQPANTQRAQPAIQALPPAVTAEEPTPAAPPSSAPLEVPLHAAAAAPPIRSVVANPISGCTAGGKCTLDLLITFQPARSNLKFGWKLEVFDRCTGATVERPGGSFTAPAGWSRIEVKSQVPVPTWNAPVLVVVTTAPSAAQSAPLALAPQAGC